MRLRQRFIHVFIYLAFNQFWNGQHNAENWGCRVKKDKGLGLTELTCRKGSSAHFECCMI